MKRQFIAWIVLIVLGLQGSLVLAAAPPSMQPDCQTSMESRADTAHKKPCCPSGAHTMSCCLDVGVMAMAISTTPLSVAWYGRSALIPVWRTARFSSRGDSPLIRPPIL
jgi:hypothetical protein